MKSGFTKKTIYMVQLTQNSDDNDFIMVIADPKIQQEGLNGWHIQQSNNKAYRPDVVFQVKARMNINRQQINQTLEVECKEEGGKFIIPYQQYNRLKNQLRDPSESSSEEQSDEEQSIDERSETSSQQFDNLVQNLETRKRGRPKGSKNKRKFMEESFEEQDQFNQQQKRGRGRPKGSKNKKTGSRKEQEHRDELKMLMEGYMKRGKGRPKGSKNKPKKKQQNDSEEGQGLDGDPNTTFWKRGKGRPRGSKNKIKNVYNDNKLPSAFQQFKEKRNRGRPPGVKNKPRSDPSISESSQNQNIGQIPELPPVPQDYQECCSRCYVRHLRKKLIDAKSVQQARQVIEEIGTANIFDNFQPQRRTNLLITALKRNNPYFFQLLLQHKNESMEYFRCCWNVSGIEQDRYVVKTKKQALSRSGKQKMLGLLHDYVPRTSNIWWREIGVERILESFSQHCSKDIIDTIKKADSQLYYELYTNVPITIRTGNYYAACIILENPPPKIQPDFYTREHLEFLKNDLQLQYKKTNILKRSMGSINYCSPIHCAAINPNGQVLENILKNTVNFNVSDNLLRKPIHYAAAAEHSINLQILSRYGADVRDLDKNKMSPLMIACLHDRPHNVKFILEKCNQPLYVNHRSDEGYSALHYAVLEGHTSVVQALMQQNSINFNSETREKQSCLDLAASTGNQQILSLLLGKGLYIDAIDRFKRTSLMMSIRNHNHIIFQQLVKQKPKLLKSDSSGNTLLHYAAAYGNLYATKYLISFIKQVQNKEGLYPWEIAVGKGHMACAKYLRNQSTVEGGQLMVGQTLQKLMLKNIVGSRQGLKVIKYLLNNYPITYKVLDENQNSPIHILCSCSQEQYIKLRSRQISNDKQIRQQFKNIFEEVIPILVQNGVEKDKENKNHETPLTIALENGNLIAMKLLLPNNIDLNYQTSSGVSMINFLAMMACMGAQQTKLVLQKLQKQNKASVLRILRGTNDDQPLLNFVRHFAWKIVSNYREQIQNNPAQSVYLANQIRTKAFKKLIEHETNFIKLMSYFQSIGANFSVKSKNSYQHGWGILHYLMQFPSIKLLEYFKKHIKDFNPLTTSGMSLLHLFCQINHKENFVDKDLNNEYNGQKSLQWLLENGCDVEILDKDNSSPIHYAAFNKQITFIVILMQHKAKINIVNKNNSVPFIQLIKMKDHLSIEEFEKLLKLGADPNFSDKNKRSPLHHLVSNSKNFDSSPRLCRLLESYGAQINSLDQLKRTPLFYCFIQIDEKDKMKANGKHDSSDDQTTNDKLEIVQTLINFQKIDLNHIDSFGRTAVHYACQKNYFFSILYLLDKNIDIRIQDNQGNTPLAVCLISKNLDQAAILLKKGTAMGYVNENGKRMTYFSYALSNSLVGICHLLLDHGYPPQQALKQDVVKDNIAFKKIIIQKCKGKIPQIQ